MTDLLMGEIRLTKPRPINNTGFLQGVEVNTPQGSFKNVVAFKEGQEDQAIEHLTDWANNLLNNQWLN